jgi:hypothetical protein
MNIDELFKYALIGWLFLFFIVNLLINSGNKLFDSFVRIICFMCAIPLTVVVMKSFNLLNLN